MKHAEISVFWPNSENATAVGLCHLARACGDTYSSLVALGARLSWHGPRLQTRSELKGNNGQCSELKGNNGQSDLVVLRYRFLQRRFGFEKSLAARTGPRCNH